MRTKPAGLMIALCGIFATTAVFGQTTYTWTGAADGTNYANPGNWDLNMGAPIGCVGETAQWNGLTTSNLFLAYNPTFGCDPFGPVGLDFVVTGNQTNSVTITSPIANSPNLTVRDINVSAGAGALTFGNPASDSRKLWIIARPPGATHDWGNNSTNPVTFDPQLVWGSGGGADWTAQFSGTGDWHINNYFVNNNSGNVSFIVNGPGTVYWNPTGYLGPFSIGTPITINGGFLVLQGSHPRLYSQQIMNSSLFDFDAPGFAQTLSGNIAGPGELRVSNGTLKLTGNSTYTGTTVVSNGTLIVNGGNISAATIVNGGTLGGTGTLSGPVTLNSTATLAPGASANSVGTFTINNDLTFGGKLAIEVDKSLAQSNDLAIVSGLLTNTGTGTLTVSKLGILGPPLAPGDRFTLFNKPVQNGAALTITGSGVSWMNNLEVDGSIIVSSPTLNFTNLGGTNLEFYWVGDFSLQWQTNSLNVGISNNWGNYPGGGTSPVTVPIDGMRGAVFFRLVPVPVKLLRQENP